MAYRIDVDQVLSEEISRVARQRVTRALRAIDRAAQKADNDGYDSSVAADIFEIRRRCKQIRALAHLVEPDSSTSRKLDRRAKRAGKALAPIRDYEAAVAARLALSALSGESPPATALPILEPPSVVDIQASLTTACSQLLLAKDLAAAWMPNDGFATLEIGLEQTFREGRRQLRLIERETMPGRDSVDEFHEWRKSAKYLRYQLRLLRDFAPPHIDPLINELDQINALLGRDHDLSLVYGPSAVEPSSIDEQHYRLQSAALEIGTMVYAERPRAFVRRVGAYWSSATRPRSTGF